MRISPKAFKCYARKTLRLAGYFRRPGDGRTHAADGVGPYAVARLKDNLPELFAQARQLFGHAPPHYTFRDCSDRIAMWDADDFDPLETLQWPTVRVFRYRQHKPDGTVVDACWLTNFPIKRVGPRGLYRFAKNRWEVENQVFNDDKNRPNRPYSIFNPVNLPKRLNPSLPGLSGPAGRGRLACGIGPAGLCPNKTGPKTRKGW